MGLFRRNLKPVITTDEELLQSYRTSGNLAVLGQLYEPLMPLVYGVCLKYLQDEEQSKDAVMQIFEELIVKARQHEIKQFRSWLYVLARNHCLMKLRSSKKMETINLDEIMESELFVHPGLNDSEDDVKSLEHCLQQLSHAQQQSINLFYYQKKCYKEIADMTGYELNAVKSYIQNGKRNLKICLEKRRDS